MLHANRITDVKFVSGSFSNQEKGGTAEDQGELTLTSFHYWCTVW
jgi:hypothetical protein